MLQEQSQSQRFWLVLLIIILSLGCIYFFVIPFLASQGIGSGGNSGSGGWSTVQQRQIAYNLAQNIQNYRHRINERRRVNYGDAYIEATGITKPYRPPNPFDGMDSPIGAKNDTHSEAKLKGWALATIRRNLQHLPSGSTINVLIFTQVKTCPDCRKSAPIWVKQLQQAAPKGVTVYLYIWQQTNFDIDHPDQTQVASENDVELATSAIAPGITFGGTMSTTNTLPDSIERAFRTFYYGGQYEKALDTFTEQWGGVDIQTMTRVLAEGKGDAKALAILALGYSGIPRISELLLPFLRSSEPLERWTSALVLGEMRDERALPVLISLLDEFLPPRLHPLEREGGLYHFWRIKIVALLGEWGRKESAPTLRYALSKSWNIEQVDHIDRRQIWYPFQDELAYALGRLSSFGALTGLSVPTARLHLWVVTMVCGSLRARTRYGDLLTQLQINQAFQDEVAQILEVQFGLSAQEQRECIDNYVEEYFARMEWG